VAKGEAIDVGLGTIEAALLASLRIGSAEIGGTDMMYIILEPAYGGVPLVFPIPDRATADDIRDQLAALTGRMWPQGG
jgi:hypothetical protein